MEHSGKGRELAGICGIYCGTCPRYLAYQHQDLEELQKIAKEDNVPVQKVRCDGCLSNHVYGSCIDCRHGFRRCSQEENVTWCFECPNFPCQRLRDFKNIHVVNGIWHHKRVIDHLQFMKDPGVEAWVEEQEREGACPNCGKMLYWYVLECPHCGSSARKPL